MRLTLWGMYKYDERLFNDTIVLPEGMDTEIMADLILEECGDLWPYYQALPHFKHNMHNWWIRKNAAFTAMWQALQLDYNPIENYDRFEDSTESPDITKKRTPDLIREDQPDITVTESPDVLVTIASDNSRTTTGTAHTGESGSNEKSVSAFDAIGYSPRERTTTTNAVDNTTSDTEKGESGGTQTTTGKTTSHETGKRTYTEQGTDINTETGVITRHSHIHGNVGVTTNQQMIESELELRKFDIYMYICDQFIDQFIITIY